MRTALCLVSIFLACLTGTLACAAPNLQVREPGFDFGEVFQGDKVLHVYQFSNQGDQDLLIDRVSSSCGCTAVLVSSKNVPPGARGELQANFDSSRFRGEVSKTIYLYSNDPARPVMQLHLQGKVLEIVDVKPNQVNFGEVKAKQPVAATVILRNVSNKSLTLGGPRTTATELKVKMPRASFATGDEVTLELQLTPKPGQPRFSGYVLVPVDGLPKNELRIPVYATIADQ
jgi:hypothetical protein